MKNEQHLVSEWCDKFDIEIIDYGLNYDDDMLVDFNDFLLILTDCSIYFRSREGRRKFEQYDIFL